MTSYTSKTTIETKEQREANFTYVQLDNLEMAVVKQVKIVFFVCANTTRDSGWIRYSLPLTTWNML